MIQGYNFYENIGAGYIKVNTQLLGTPVYTRTGLASATSGTCYFTAVDTAGNESQPGTVASFETLAGAAVMVIDNSSRFFNTQSTGLPSPLSEVRILTSAPSMTVTFMSDEYSASSLTELYRLGVWDGATYAGDVAATASGSNSKTITLPGSGTRTVRIVDSGQARPSDMNDVKGTYLTKIQIPEGHTISLVTPVKAGRRVYSIVDSIGSGVGTTSAPRYSWASRLRETETYDIIIDGFGWRSFTRSLGTQALVDAQAQRAVDALAGAAKKQVWIALGTNDFGGNYGNAATAAAKAAMLVDKLQSLDATIEIFLQTPLFRTGQTTPNSFGETLANYTAALEGLASTRSWLTVVNAAGWLVSADFIDGLHPSNAGMLKYAGLIKSTLDGAVMPMTASTYATVENTENLAPRDFTVIAKIKTPSTAEDGIVACKAVKFASGSLGGLFGLYLTTDQKLQGAIYPDFGPQVSVFSTEVLAPNTEYKVALMVSHENYVKIRINDNTYTTNTGASGGISADRIWISGLYTQGAGRTIPFKGELSNFSFTEQVFSDADLAGIFANDCQLSSEILATGKTKVYTTLKRASASVTTFYNEADSSKVVRVHDASTPPPVVVQPVRPFKFNGTSQQAKVRDSGPLALGEMTVTGVLIPGKLTGFQFLVNKYISGSGSANNTKTWSLYLNGSKLSFEFTPAGGSAMVTTAHTATLQVGKVSVFGVRFKAGEKVKIWIDGVLTESAAVASAALNTNTHYIQLATIDTATTPTGYYQGGQRRLSIWNTALPDATIAEIMGTANGTKQAGEVLSTGTYPYTHANCLVYAPLERTGSELVLPNLAKNYPLDLLGY